MSRGINKVILVGYLGADPDSRAMPSGMTACNFRVATTERWTDKQTGEMREQTEWHSLAAFGRLAEVCAEYLRKGSQVYVEGRLRTRKWQDKNGVDRYTTEILVGEMQMLGKAPSDQAEHQRPNGQAAAHQQQPAQQTPAIQAPLQPPADGQWDDDIPF